MNEPYELILGDCLEEMKTINDETVDIVLTDPPYMLNLKSSKGSKKYKISQWMDMCNPATWYAAWIRECYRILKPDGCLWSFLNWRTVATYQKAACDADWSIESLLVWDKQWTGLGSMKGLRNSYEMVALFLKGAYSLPNRSLSDVWQFQGSSAKPNGHPAEKPVGLMEKILRECPGEVVLDPFMGSGTVGVAALKLGKYYIGIEQNPQWFEISKRRLEFLRVEAKG
jgi:site-specific DNA-methyltransferase (adenine-specific)